jgi:ATP/maltotriose-dependent transcriptional regulator MalT
VAGNVAAFAAIYRFDFDAAHRFLSWAAPYQEMMGPFALVYARYIAGADKNFREAFEIGARIGPQSHAARLAGALLGQVLYETGELAEATALLDESYHLGAEGGGVDYLAARFVIGARTKAAQGDLGTATDRLDAGMKAAEQLRLPRLAAAINNERIRLGIPIAPPVAARLRSSRTIPCGDGIATITAEFDEDSAIRLLSTSDSAEDWAQACRRASDLRAGIDADGRPWAVLTAQLLVEALTAAGRSAEAAAEAPVVIAQCTELGLSRMLVDAGLAQVMAKSLGFEGRIAWAETRVPRTQFFGTSPQHTRAAEKHLQHVPDERRQWLREKLGCNSPSNWPCA